MCERELYVVLFFVYILMRIICMGMLLTQYNEMNETAESKLK